jgi:hypothetical protein
LSIDEDISMNCRNRKLRSHFINGDEYRSKKDNRGVQVYTDSTTGNTIITAMLHDNHIVSRISKPNGEQEFRINYAGWNTITTTIAINACIPGGWRLSRGQLITPKGMSIKVPMTGWVLLEEPADRYLKEWV